MSSKKNKDINKKEGLKQGLRNVGAAAGGSALGYFGAGTLLDKARKSPYVLNKINSMSDAEKASTIKNLKRLSGLGSTTAAALSSIALHEALNKDTEEKVANFCIQFMHKGSL